MAGRRLPQIGSARSGRTGTMSCAHAGLFRGNCCYQGRQRAPRKHARWWQPGGAHGVEVEKDGWHQGRSRGCEDRSQRSRNQDCTTLCPPANRRRAIRQSICRRALSCTRWCRSCDTRSPSFSRLHRETVTADCIYTCSSNTKQIVVGRFQTTISNRKCKKSASMIHSRSWRFARCRSCYTVYG